MKENLFKNEGATSRVDIDDMGRSWGIYRGWLKIRDVGEMLLTAYALLGCKGLSKTNYILQIVYL